MDFYDLAPLDLRSRRVRRYLGDDLCLPLNAFAAADQDGIRWLYDFLQELFIVVSVPSDLLPSNVAAFLDRYDLDEFMGQVRNLGRASQQTDLSPRMAKTVHDIRGGGLTPLLGLLQLLSFPQAAVALEPVYFLARDHLKIMRNALLGLDDAKRTEDLQPKLHSTDFIVEKWKGATLHHGGRETRLQVECPRRANISECCVEFGALDRILYNMMNNATRHAAGDHIDLTILPIPIERADTLRFVLVNQLRSEDAVHLSQIDPRTLFDAGVSTTGSGYGLNVAAEFVANAFGLDTPRAAVEGGYLGALPQGGEFVAWFHWPTVAD